MDTITAMALEQTSAAEEERPAPVGTRPSTCAKSVEERGSARPQATGEEAAVIIPDVKTAQRVAMSFSVAP